MMKQVNVTFNYDAETDTVSDVKCMIDGIEKKKKTTRKAKDIAIEELAPEAIITLESNKLVFNNRAVSDMELNYEDRIVIKWKQEGKVMVPIIGKDTSFGEEGTGNKVTKTNTVTYKGKANTVLAERGSTFTLEKYSENIWKLVSTSQTVTDTVDKLEDIQVKAENTEADLIVDTDEETEVEFKFTL